MNDHVALSERSVSPGPALSPTFMTASAPPIDRPVSAMSASSSGSGSGSGGSSSKSSRLSWGGIPNGRRGYMRPEGTEFADSAKNRESVQSLGTISHLQYYFARTGLLDDKGGRVAKERRKKKRAEEATDGPHTTADRAHSDFSLSLDDGSKRSSFVSDDGSAYESIDIPFVDSPVDYAPPPMLPPTVSTYRHKVMYTAPLPAIAVLRRELREALQDARDILQRTRTAEKQYEAAGKMTPELEQEPLPQRQEWTELQGLDILDNITLAIKAAKNYYTAHEKPQMLYSIKPEKTIRKELYQVLEVLKRMAGRDFEGGIRDDERQAIDEWIKDIESLLDKEEAKEQAEEAEREKWSWREGDWTGRERERERLFLKSFDADDATDELPAWTDPASAGALPTPFLHKLHSGLRLVSLHNELVHQSRRQFEEIKTFHTDTSLPYRCAENLRYWVKAAELRWEIKLKVNVMEVVHGERPEAWVQFDDALLKWCKGVREEITREWREQRTRTMRMPTLRIE
ncbi:hypothetical protein BC567DRAFT_161089 [Phyllosticta citribraziliensis]